MELAEEARVLFLANRKAKAVQFLARRLEFVQQAKEAYEFQKRHYEKLAAMDIEELYASDEFTRSERDKF